MSVTSTVNKHRYEGDSIIASFDYDFKITDKSEIKVVLVDKTVTPATETTLTVDTDYTVSGVGVDAGGSVAYPVSGTKLAANQFIVLKPNYAFNQPDSLRDQGGFSPEVHEGLFDRVVMLCKQLKEEVTRAVSLSDASEDDAATLLQKIEDADGYATAAQTAQTAAETAQGAAETAQTAAEAAAAGVTLPSIVSGDALKFPRVKSDETGYELLTASELAAAINPHITVTTFTTGDIMGTATATKAGWLKMNNGSTQPTLGDTGSSADNEGSSYEDLYTHLWDNYSDTDAPVSTGRGASAAADWTAGKTIGLPKMSNRGLVGAGQDTGFTSRTLGAAFGDDTKAIAEANLPAHTHGVGTLATDSAGNHTHGITMANPGGTTYPDLDSAKGSNSVSTLNTNSAGAHTHPMSGDTGSVGSGTELDIANPSRAINWFIKL